MPDGRIEEERRRFLGIAGRRQAPSYQLSVISEASKRRNMVEGLKRGEPEKQEANAERRTPNERRGEA